MKIVKFLSEKDIFKNLVENIDQVDVGYRRAVIFGFLTCLVAYGFQLTHVIMSPDMYNEIVTGDTYPINYSGRWFMAFIRNVLLFDHRIVPTFNLLISIFLFICSSLLIVKMWRIKRPLYIYIIICTITANTYTCHILRWENAHIEASLSTFIAVLALYLSGKGVKMFFPALFLMACAHGGYQTGVAFSCVALFSGIALWIYQDGNLKNFHQYIKTKLIPALVVLLGGFVFHKIILKLLMMLMDLQEGIRLEDAQLPKGFGDLINNIALALNSMPSIFSHQVLYFNYQITFFYKLFFGLFVFSLVVFFLRKKSKERLSIILLCTFLAFSALMSTYLPTIAIGYEWTSNRILFPVAVFQAFVGIFVLLSSSIPLKNIATISFFCLIFLFSWHNNMYAYRSFVQDRADFELTSRIISRIENLPEYEEYISKPLKLARIGTKDIAIQGYRFTATPNIKVRSEGAFSQTWSADGIFNYLHFPHARAFKFGTDDQTMSQEMAETILRMEEWPSHKSVSIVDGVALVMFDKRNIPNNVYSTLFLNENPEDGFVILPDNDHLKPTQQIHSWSQSGEFISSGNDPQISLIIPEIKNDRRYIIRVRLDVPSRTVAQLFYKVNSQKYYSEKHSFMRYVSSGSNQCYFVLDGTSTHVDFRLDPGTVPGKYTIKDIAVREITPKNY